MDPLTILSGGALLCVGVLIGRAMRPKPVKDPGPVCSCGHGYGQHENAGRCGAEAQRACDWTYGGSPMAWEYVRCACLSYDGPEPLPKVWTPGGGL